MGDCGFAAGVVGQQQILAEASRFVIAPDALALLNEINASTSAESFHAARMHCVAPAYRTWIEWFCPKRGARAGFLLEGEDPDRPAVRGRACMVVASRTVNGDRVPAHLMCSWDMPSNGPAMRIETANLPDVSALLPNLSQDFQEDLVQILITALALIASPRLARTTPVDLSLVNRKRRRLGRDELLEHSEISLTLDAAQSAADRVRSNQGGASRAFHHVRAHFRFKRGRIELVRHHTRGDKSLGETRQRFTLRAPK
ncbi:MAG: hypothetical protein AB7P97_18905 [Hyphomonadaceae bacterium]